MITPLPLRTIALERLIPHTGVRGNLGLKQEGYTARRKHFVLWAYHRNDSRLSLAWCGGLVERCLLMVVYGELIYRVEGMLP